MNHNFCLLALEPFTEESKRARNVTSLEDGDVRLNPPVLAL